MPTYETGDMWQTYGKTNLFCITTNSTITKDGALVMGAGIAKQAKQKWPGIEYKLGARLKGQNIYGFLPSPNYPTSTLGLFQTKIYWQDPSPISLIETSAMQLHDWLLWQPNGTRVDLNFPGIGNGGLDERDVLPILSQLPPCVHIWRR